MRAVTAVLSRVNGFIDRWFPWAMPLGAGVLFLETTLLSTVLGWSCIAIAALHALSQLLGAMAWLLGQITPSDG